MNMNVRFGWKFVLLTLVCVAGPATAGATDRGGPALGYPVASTSATAADKAAEAKRLAAQAAELAQRAAVLAAESQAEESAAAAPKTINVVTQSTPWSTRGAAEVLISDSDSQPAASAMPSTVPSPVPTIGWRSHRGAPNSAIRFSDPSVPASSPTTNSTPTIKKPAPIAASSQPTNPQTSDGFELKLTEAALAAKIYNLHGAPIAAEPAPAATNPVATVDNAAPKAAAAKTTTTSAEPQPLQGEGIRLATTKFADAEVKTADSEEPMPVPTTPYANDRPLGSGDDVPSECLDGACCPQPRPLFWTSGIEATFLRPDLNDGFAGFSALEVVDERFDEFSTSTDDVDDFYMSPRIWVGVQGCLWGANLRYFHLRAGEGSFDPTLGSDGQWDGPNCGTPDFGYTSCNDLEAYTVDLEITRRVCLHDCWMQFSAGVRHAEIEHDASLIATALADDSVIFGFAGAHRQTRGTGIVLGWYGRKPIFPCSCVHWFYNFHWSAVWGPTETAAETGVLLSLTSQDPDAIATAGSVNGASTSVDDNLFIGEIQLGLEWDYALRCLPANAFCRVALEYQRWSGGQGFSAANSFAGAAIDDGSTVTTTTIGDALALADAPELDLIGLAVSTGLTW